MFEAVAYQIRANAVVNVKDAAKNKKKRQKRLPPKDPLCNK
jgi:hypothetical protein